MKIELEREERPKYSNVTLRRDYTCPAYNSSKSITVAELMEFLMNLPPDTVVTGGQDDFKVLEWRHIRYEEGTNGFPDSDTEKVLELRFEDGQYYED